MNPPAAPKASTGKPKSAQPLLPVFLFQMFKTAPAQAILVLMCYKLLFAFRQFNAIALAF